jgi:hypothetical protein
MKFEKGNKLAKGGRRNPPGGRPTKQAQEIKKLAAEISRDYIEKHIGPIMETYVALAAGKVVERKTEDGQKIFELKVDPQTTRDAVNKFLPPAKQEIGIDAKMNDSRAQEIREYVHVIMRSKEGRELAERSVRLMLDAMKASASNGKPHSGG